MMSDRERALREELEAEIREAGDLIIDTCRPEGLDLAKGDRALLIEIGFQAGMGAAMAVLSRRQMITTPGEGLIIE